MKVAEFTVSIFDTRAWADISDDDIDAVAEKVDDIILAVNALVRQEIEKLPLPLRVWVDD